MDKNPVPKKPKCGATKISSGHLELELSDNANSFLSSVCLHYPTNHKTLFGMDTNLRQPPNPDNPTLTFQKRYHYFSFIPVVVQNHHHFWQAFVVQDHWVQEPSGNELFQEREGGR